MKTTRTSAQRYNDKMHRIFEEAKVLKAKHAPKHAFQVLARMTEKVKRAYSIQQNPYSIQQNLTQEDWNELNKICREAEEVLEYAPKEYEI